MSDVGLCHIVLMAVSAAFVTRSIDEGESLGAFMVRRCRFN